MSSTAKFGDDDKRKILVVKAERGHSMSAFDAITQSETNKSKIKSNQDEFLQNIIRTND